MLYIRKRVKKPMNAQLRIKKMILKSGIEIMILL